MNGVQPLERAGVETAKLVATGCNCEPMCQNMHWRRAALDEPVKLNLACGNRLGQGEEWVNHDRYRHRREVAVAHDVTVYPWPFDDDTFSEIIAFDIIEHVHETLKFIEELWRIAKDGARVFVHTAWASPSSDARQVWRDPTHVRPFHEDSFHYFDPERGGYWYKNYGKFYSHARFRIDSISKEPPDCIGFYLTALKG